MITLRKQDAAQRGEERHTTRDIKQSHKIYAEYLMNHRQHEMYHRKYGLRVTKLILLDK